MNFSKKLKKLRESNGLSYQQLADKVEVTKTLIWSYENENTSPTLEVIKRLAIFFNVTADYLIFEDNERPDMIKLSDDSLIKKFNQILKLDPENREFFEKTIDMFLKNSKK